MRLHRALLLVATTTFGLTAQPAAADQMVGAASVTVFSGCKSGSSCVTPGGGSARATTTDSQDVIVEQAQLRRDVRNGYGSKACQIAGASECVAPMAATVAIIPYPQVTFPAIAYDSTNGIRASWGTVNAAATQMTCGNNNGTVFNGAVSAGATDASFGNWPSGTYVCTITATNSVGRQVSASQTVVVPDALLSIKSFSKKSAGSFNYEIYYGGVYYYYLQDWTSALLSWSTASATSASMDCSQTQWYNWHRGGPYGLPSGDGHAQGFEPLVPAVPAWSGVVPPNQSGFKVPGSDTWSPGVWTCVLTATDVNGGRASQSITVGSSPYNTNPRPTHDTTITYFNVQGPASNAVGYWQTNNAKHVYLNCSPDALPDQNNAWDPALAVEVPLQAPSGFAIGAVPSSAYPANASNFFTGAQCALRAYSDTTTAVSLGVYGMPGQFMEQVKVNVPMIAE